MAYLSFVLCRRWLKKEMICMTFSIAQRRVNSHDGDEVKGKDSNDADAS